MEFQFHLERELRSLHRDLMYGMYRHGTYRTFIVRDPKERMISVASVRDRLVHRLLYDYLVSIYDREFMFDVWSSRKDKGLTKALARLQSFVKQYEGEFFWRADIHRFFDHIDHTILLQLLERRIHDVRAFSLLREVIDSFPYPKVERERESCRIF